MWCAYRGNLPAHDDLGCRPALPTHYFECHSGIWHRSFSAGGGCLTKSNFAKNFGGVILTPGRLVWWAHGSRPKVKFQDALIIYVICIRLMGKILLYFFISVVQKWEVWNEDDMNELWVILLVNLRQPLDDVIVIIAQLGTKTSHGMLY